MQQALDQRLIRQALPPAPASESPPGRCGFAVCRDAVAGVCSPKARIVRIVNVAIAGWRARAIRTSAMLRKGAEDREAGCDHHPSHPGFQLTLNSATACALTFEQREGVQHHHDRCIGRSRCRILLDHQETHAIGRYVVCERNPPRTQYEVERIRTGRPARNVAPVVSTDTATSRLDASRKNSSRPFRARQGCCRLRVKLAIVRRSRWGTGGRRPPAAWTRRTGTRRSAHSAMRPGRCGLPVDCNNGSGGARFPSGSTNRVQLSGSKNCRAEPRRRW